MEPRPSRSRAPSTLPSAPDRRSYSMCTSMDSSWMVSISPRNPELAPRSCAADPLDDDEVVRVQRDARRRIERVLRRRGLLTEAQGDPAPVAKGKVPREDSSLPFLCAASAQSRVAVGSDTGRPLPRIVDTAVANANRHGHPRIVVPGSLLAEPDGDSLHAAIFVPDSDRGLLEPLCPFIDRPALAFGRLQLRDDGKVIWSLHKP